jgi:hypothetical protein
MRKCHQVFSLEVLQVALSTMLVKPLLPSYTLDTRKTLLKLLDREQRKRPKADKDRSFL